MFKKNQTKYLFFSSVIRVDVLGVPVPDQPRPEEQDGRTTEQGSAQARAISMSFGNGFAQLEVSFQLTWIFTPRPFIVLFKRNCLLTCKTLQN